MEKDKWVHADKPDVMVITTKNIIKGRMTILSVWHDEDDGIWQFLDGTDVNEEDAMIVSLQHIVNLDESVKDVLDIPLGWVAWRKDKDSEWKRKKQWIEK